MVNYKLGKIYAIECNVTGQKYIGSTCEPTLSKRLTKHVGNYRCYLKGTYHYVSSFKIFENGNYFIVLLETYPCDTKDELLARERYWCNELECINQCKNQGMINELGIKEYTKQYKKQYREKNKDIINGKHDCICGNCYTYKNKSQHLKSKKHQQYLYYLKYKTIIDGLNMIKALDKYFN
jgi:hypothetical protein